MRGPDPIGDELLWVAWPGACLVETDGTHITAFRQWVDYVSMDGATSRTANTSATGKTSTSRNVVTPGVGCLLEPEAGITVSSVVRR